LGARENPFFAGADIVKYPAEAEEIGAGGNRTFGSNESFGPHERTGVVEAGDESISASLGTPWTKMMLAGLMSRWMSPWPIRVLPREAAATLSVVDNRKPAAGN
jgi:hypothetical protein